MLLTSLDIWVQVYDLPFGYTTDLVLEQVNNFVGSLVSLDETNFACTWRCFYRVRVSLDVTKPLKRRMKLFKRDRLWVWVNFKYEWLHAFCFFYRLLGHTDRFCMKAREAGVTPEQYPYGAWMRARVGRSARNIGSRWLVTEQMGDGWANGGVGQVNAKVKGLQSADVVTSELEGIVAGPKRRKGCDSMPRQGELGDDAMVVDLPKNLFMAGVGIQPCPSQ